jgi:CHAT domain-containing protein
VKFPWGKAKKAEKEPVPPADDPLWHAVVAYFNAPSELVARITIRQHREQMAQMAPTLLSQEGQIGISGVSSLGNARARLLARCFEIGSISEAFFESYQNGTLPFRLEQPEDRVPVGDDLGGPLTPELRSLLTRAITAEEAHQAAKSAVTRDEAIAAMKSLIASRDFAQQSEYFQNGFLNHSAVYLLERFQSTGDVRDADLAIAHYRQIITDDYRLGVADYYGNMGNVYQSKFRRFGNLADLDSSIAAHLDALELTPVNSPHWHFRMGNFGNGLWYRYQVTGEFEDMQSAHDPLAVAAAIAPLDAPERPGHLNNLADVLTHYADLAARASDVDQAQQSAGRSVDLARESVATTPAGSIDLPRHLATLSHALMIKGAIGAASSDGKFAAEIMDEAIHSAERSVALTPDGTDDRVEREGLLGNLMAITARAASEQGTLSHDEISQYFRRSVGSGRQTNSAAAVRRAHEWGRWAARAGRWDEAAEAYMTAIEAMATLFGAQEVRTHKEARLRQVQDLPGEAAFACGQAGDSGAAVRLLEQGRAVLLTEALGRQAVTGDLLRAAGAAELAERYEAAQSEAARLELDPATDPLSFSGLDFAFSQVTDNRRQVADKGRELTELAARARQVLGIDARFSAVTTEDALAVSSAARPVLYIAATVYGGIAIMLADPQVRTVWLPGLRADELKRRTEGYLAAHASRGTDHLAWLQEIDQVTGWLWDAIAQPLLDELGAASELLVVPVGLLGLLPLHAAWSADPGKAGDRRYLLDQVGISYTPNIRLFREAQRKAADLPDQTAVIVADPRPSTAPPLPYAAIEARYVRTAFQDATELHAEAASGEELRGLLGGSDMLHFACHAQADAVEPLNGGIMLAGDEQLTLRDILRGSAGQRRLVVLSACETAVINAALANEVISLNTGFLQAGAAGIIGSLWSVPDASTAMLMKYFYTGWRQAGRQPAEALRQAQLSIRDATNSDIIRDFPEFGNFVKPPLSDKARVLWGTARRYAHPYYWAAFTYLGA